MINNNGYCCYALWCKNEINERARKTFKQRLKLGDIAAAQNQPLGI